MQVRNVMTSNNKTNLNKAVENRLRRLSYNQLSALNMLANSQHGLVSSTFVGKKLNITGKPLGGIFSSLSRQKIYGELLIFPVGQAPDGRGLRWKLNEAIISVKDLQKLTKSVLTYWK